MRSFAVALTVLCAAGVAEARTVTLEEAARDPNLEVHVVSPGGYDSAHITVRNNGQDDVHVVGTVGDMLENGNTSEQNLIFGQGMSLRVGPGETAATTVGTYCINPDRSSPSMGANFVPRPNDHGLQSFVRSNGGGGAGGFRGDLQGAVWDFVRDRVTHNPVNPPRNLRLIERSPVELRIVEGAVPFTGEAPAAQAPPNVELQAIQIQPENPPERITQPVPQPRPRHRRHARHPHPPAAPDPQSPIILIPD
jgi:hypothetical protein